MLAEIVTTVYGASASIAVQVQISNDLENWTSAPTGGAATITAVGYQNASVATGIAAAYARLKISQANSNVSIISAGVNLAAL